MGFSENLRKRREERKVSQIQLAELVGVSQGLISQYETGICQPSVTLGVVIAKALDVTAEELVGGVKA